MRRFSFIVLLTLITHDHWVMTQEYFSNEPLTSSAGIYFEDLGNLQLQRSSWKLVTYVNLKPLQGKEENLASYLQEIKRLCSTNVAACEYKTELESLESKMRRLRMDRDTISDLIGNSSSSSSSIRGKRGLFDFVGKVKKFLFGTLDSTDADYYTEQINRLYHNSRIVTELVKKQISIMQSTIDEFSQAFKKSSKKFEDIDSNMRLLNNEITNHARELNRIKMNAMVHSHIAQCGDMILEYEIGLEVLANAILLGRRGLLHPKILTPRHFFNELLKHRDDMIRHRGRKFPVPLDLNYFATLIDLSDISLFYSDNKLIYVIEVPLTDPQDFRLYNLVPIPVMMRTTADGPRQDAYSFINPTERYMGLSEDRKLYTLFTENDVIGCKRFGKSEYVCTQSQPLHDLGHTEGCETEILKSSGTVKIVEECDVRVARIQSTLWLQLKAPNTWIYAAPIPEKLRITCTGVRTTNRETDLSSTGIIVLGKDCDAVSEGVFLHSRTGEVVQTISKDFVPTFALDMTRITKDIETASRLNVSELPLLNLGKIPRLNIDTLRKASASLRELYNQADEIGKQYRTETFYERTISVAIYIGYAVVALLVLYVIVKIVTIFKKKK